MPNVETEASDIVATKKIRIGEASVDVSKNQISVAGQTHQLEPRLMRVLLALCANAGEVVDREDLLSAVSSLPFAGDESLTQAISKLRTILDDSSKAPKYIKTIPRKGYLLLVPVEIIETPLEEMAAYVAGRSRKQIAGSIIVLTATIITIVALWPSEHREIEFIEKKDTEFIEREKN